MDDKPYEIGSLVRICGGLPLIIDCTFDRVGRIIGRSTNHDFPIDAHIYLVEFDFENERFSHFNTIQQWPYWEGKPCKSGNGFLFNHFQLALHVEDQQKVGID